MPDSRLKALRIAARRHGLSFSCAAEAWRRKVTAWSLTMVLEAGAGRAARGVELCKNWQRRVEASVPWSEALMKRQLTRAAVMKWTRTRAGPRKPSLGSHGAQ